MLLLTRRAFFCALAASAVAAKAIPVGWPKEISELKIENPTAYFYSMEGLLLGEEEVREDGTIPLPDEVFKHREFKIMTAKYDGRCRLEFQCA